MREEVDGNSLKRAMKVIIIPFSIRSGWRSNQTTRCISSRKFMYEPENQNGFTLEPIIEHLLLQLHVCFAGSGNSHDFFSRWTSCHEQNTWYIHTMRKEKKRHSRNIWEMNPSTHFITITILLTCSKKIYFENKIKRISFNYYHDVICEMILEAHVTPDIQNTPGGGGTPRSKSRATRQMGVGISSWYQHVVPFVRMVILSRSDYFRSRRIVI